MEQDLFREEQSAVVSRRVRKAHRPELAIIQVSGDERQEGFLEGGGKWGEHLLLMILCKCSYSYGCPGEVRGETRPV